MGRTLADDIADDVADVFTNTDDFGLVVTHRPRTGSTFDVAGTFNESGVQASLKDDRRGRSVDSTGYLLIGLVDVNGNAFTIDDQGEFVIRGKRWAVGSVSNPAGGYLVTLMAIERKTMRHLHGNS